MASIFKRTGRKGWTVEYRHPVTGKRKHRSEPTREDAERFIALAGVGNRAADWIKAQESGTSYTISGAHLMDFWIPCVYVWTRGGKVLYVGSSAYGLRRIVDRRH